MVMRPPGSAEALERRRRHAVALLDEGYTQAEVARRMKASESSVHRWRKMARRKNGLAAKPPTGRKRRMTKAQHRRLERMLAQGAQAHGWANDLWTTPRVTELIRREFGIEYHVDHVYRLLVQQLGWSSQKPERRARERDEATIERWRCQQFPHIKKRSA